jgi:hypothetical protein
MFESLVSGALDPEVVKYLKLVKHVLGGVKERLAAQEASGEPVAMLTAKVQFDVIMVWEPAIDEMLAALEVKPPPHPTHR